MVLRTHNFSERVVEIDVNEISDNLEVKISIDRAFLLQPLKPQLMICDSDSDEAPLWRALSVTGPSEWDCAQYDRL